MIILFNKPFKVLCQFTDKEKRITLSDFIPFKDVYPAGRLDYDSEGLVILTDDGKLQSKISDPKFKVTKIYWVQVEGLPDVSLLNKVQKGVKLKDGITKPAKAKLIQRPKIWDRVPPIRERKLIATSWIELSITEGRNRQVRRMTAAVGFPTLRLIRYAIGEWNIIGIKNGDYKVIQKK
jgi:23S rRNA pseudouridine2457 synthase